MKHALMIQINDKIYLTEAIFKKKLFLNRSALYHLNTRSVQYSDRRCTTLQNPMSVQFFWKIFNWQTLKGFRQRGSKIGPFEIRNLSKTGLFEDQLPNGLTI